MRADPTKQIILFTSTYTLKNSCYDFADRNSKNFIRKQFKIISPSIYVYLDESKKSQSQIVCSSTLNPIEDNKLFLFYAKIEEKENCISIRIMDSGNFIKNFEGYQQDDKFLRRIKMKSSEEDKNGRALKNKIGYVAPKLNNHVTPIWKIVPQKIELKEGMTLRIGSANADNEISEFKISELKLSYSIKQILDTTQIKPNLSIHPSNITNLVGVNYPEENNTNLTCRVCFDQQDQESLLKTFFKVCSCRIGSSPIHILCLAKQTDEKIKRILFSSPASIIQCDICKDPLPQFLAVPHKDQQGNTKLRYLHVLNPLRKPMMKMGHLAINLKQQETVIGNTENCQHKLNLFGKQNVEIVLQFNEVEEKLFLINRVSDFGVGVLQGQFQMLLNGEKGDTFSFQIGSTLFHFAIK